MVWNRRPSLPVLPPDVPIPADDRYVAQRECTAFHRAQWALAAPDAFWINHPDGRRRANVKPVQLRAAGEAGFRLPPTLMSNDPARIRRFIERHDGAVLYKPFVPTHWHLGDQGIAFNFASEVSAADLPDDEVLRLSPGIFQQRIDKAYELRVTVMGERVFAARLLSQEREESRVDWRNAFANLAVEPAELPAADAERCRRVMADLGIVFGCFDLIVTPDGDIVFLEVNEMGQFLWLDEANREINTLAPFCEFLLQGRSDFSWQPSDADPVFLELCDEASRLQEEVDAELHVDRPHYHMATESGSPLDAASVVSPTPVVARPPTPVAEPSNLSAKEST